MARRERKDSITFRCPNDILDKLDDEVEEYNNNNKRDKINRSGLMIKKIELANRFESLIEISHNPEKLVEFESQLQELLKTQNVEKVMETITDPARLDDIIFFAQNQKDKRVEQIRFQVATSR